MLLIDDLLLQNNYFGRNMHKKELFLLKNRKNCPVLGAKPPAPQPPAADPSPIANLATPPNQNNYFKLNFVRFISNWNLMFINKTKPFYLVMLGKKITVNKNFQDCFSVSFVF